MERRICGVRHMCTLALLLVSVCPLRCRASWMWLGVTAEGVPERLGCANLPLSHRQRELCRKKPFLLPSIQDGARLAIAECQSQFRHERWNCSTSADTTVFGYELTSGEPVRNHRGLLSVVLSRLSRWWRQRKNLLESKSL